eukprot:Lithocolla_globosa_v1_NODE_91_length_6522_cov_117.886655.p3 type:complete len:118 gc:universal NODE_91_length_6522_cov_117.886655:3389-3742(+)
MEKQKCPKCKTIRLKTDLRLDMPYKTCKKCRKVEESESESDDEKNNFIDAVLKIVSEFEAEEKKYNVKCRYKNKSRYVKFMMLLNQKLKNFRKGLKYYHIKMSQIEIKNQVNIFNRS